ncbi:hypothetical protein YC2023_093966 [Brassica napus]
MCIAGSLEGFSGVDPAKRRKTGKKNYEWDSSDAHALKLWLRMFSAVQAGQSMKRHLLLSPESIDLTRQIASQKSGSKSYLVSESSPLRGTFSTLKPAGIKRYTLNLDYDNPWFSPNSGQQ